MKSPELLVKKGDIQVDHFPWGRLEWFARQTLNGAKITLGFCHIKPGMNNPLHFHPNCDEVLHVLEGSILHQLGDESIPMNPGDSLLIPKDVAHNARNVGETEAVMSIAFDTGDRQTTHVEEAK